MSKKQKEIAVGVNRDDLIVAGIYILEQIYKLLNKKEAIVIDDGLAMGVAIDSCSKTFLILRRKNLLVNYPYILVIL